MNQQIKSKINELAELLKTQQKRASEICKVPMPHTKKNIAKEFWQFYAKTEQISYELYKQQELIEEAEVKDIYPFDSKEFARVWQLWERHFYNSKGKFISEEIKESHLEILQDSCKTDLEAIRLIKYYINLDKTYIFSLNNNTKSEIDLNKYV